MTSSHVALRICKKNLVEISVSKDKKMFKKMAAVVGTALVLSISSIAAQASSTFDFLSDRGLTSSFDISSGDLDLTVSAGYFDAATGDVTPGGLFGTALVGTTAGSGLGVSNFFDTNSEIDGFGFDDIAIFSFNKEVKFESVTFLNLDNDDEFTFFAGDPLAVQGFDLAMDTDLALSNYISTMFGIGASDGGFFSPTDNFTIASISVTAVPLPSSLLLFGGALLGMGWLSRRKLKSAAIA